MARRVKLADLNDNCRLSRTILRPRRLHRSVLSVQFRADRIAEQEYRRLIDLVG